MNTDDIPPDIDFSGAERGKYAERAKVPEGWHRYVIAEIHRSEHIGEYHGRTWVVTAKNRVEAMKQIDHAHPDHGPMRVVDDDEGKEGLK